MPYKTSGSLSQPMDLTVLDLDGNLQARRNLSTGPYEINGLTTSSGIVFGTTANDSFKGFGKVPFSFYGLDATGGTISYSGNYKIHTFLSSGTLQVLQNTDNRSAEYLVVGGGGGGGYAQATGGAGGTIVSGTITPTVQSYTVTIGPGGAGGIQTHVTGYTGTSSVFGAFTATGGTGGTTNGNPGPSGNGYTGGSKYGNDASPTLCGGGAGGGGNGGAASVSNGGVGGIGRLINITGTPTYYAGGGGGGCYTASGAKTGGVGGTGGGGHGSDCFPLGNQTAGTDNTGGGGGGGGQGPVTSNGSVGGSGIVIVRYLIS
jgi:hypothetical protein